MTAATASHSRFTVGANCTRESAFLGSRW